MNNNRNSQNGGGNNNRRRGRGNNNRPQGGGGRGEQLNRIDSRARGNAPQMLEKYKKLASDAHLNGDRVQAEYYLQFADHYFRVIADQRLRQEEQRAPRPERQDGSSDPFARQDENEGEDYGNEGDFPGFDQPAAYRRDEQREPRSERNDQREPRNDQRGERGNEPRNEQRGEREPRAEREPRPFREQPREAQDQAPPQRPRSETTASGDAAEQGGNPFTRNDSRGDNRGEGRGTRGLRPRREPRAPRIEQDGEPLGLDPSLLPPAITETREAAAAEPVAPAPEQGPAAAPAPAAAPNDLVDMAEAPAPRRRGRPRKVVPEAPVETVDG